MSDVVLLSGSPVVNSSSSKLLDVVGTLLYEENYATTKISIMDIPLADLFYGKINSTSLEKVLGEIENAKGIVISSPVYKASYTGALKLLFDILPKRAFQQKAVLPIMTGGSPAHLLALEYMLKPMITLLKGDCLGGVYVTDNQLDKRNENPIIDKDIAVRIEYQVYLFKDTIQKNVVMMTS